MVVVHDTSSECVLQMYEVSLNTSNGGYGHEISFANDQRETTPKYPKRSYGSCAWHIVSLCSRSAWSFNQIALTVFNLQSGPKKLVLLHGKLFEKLICRVMDLVRDTSSKCALQMYEISSKYHLRFLSYRADTILWRTDRQTDRWTDARGKTICLPTVPAGDINIPCLFVYTRISFNSLLRFREPVNGLWPKLGESWLDLVTLT